MADSVSGMDGVLIDTPLGSPVGVPVGVPVGAGVPVGTVGEVRDVAGAVLSGIGQLRDAEFYRFGRAELLETGRVLESLTRTL